LEFCQWLKAFYDQSGAERIDYDPSAVRARGKGGKKYNNLLNNTAAKHGSKPLPAGRNRSKVTPTPTSTSSRKAKPQPPTRPATRTTAPRPAPGRPAPAPRPAPAKTTKAPLKASENKTRTAAHTEKVQVDAQLMKKNAEMETKVLELETSVLELEKERDFYFEKLRNVELMLQVQHDKDFEGCDLEGVVGNIFKILYATAEEGVDVAEDGEVSSFLLHFVF
jgi:RP/EB family microtubule-associated protein